MRGLRAELRVGGASPGPGAFPFFALTLALTWAAWAPAAIARSEPSPLLFALGGISPSLWGVVLTLRGSREARRDFRARLLDPRRIPAVWWAVVLLLFPALTAASLALVAAWGGALPSPEPALRTLTSPGRLALFLGVILVGGPLAEELGWRGYALDRLQARHGALASSLILAGVGLLWHLPLFFMQGTSQGEMGFATPLFWAWAVRSASMHVLHTWVYNHCGRSILAAIAFHFMTNASFSLITGIGGALPEGVAIVRALLHVAVAAAVVALFGPRRLRRDAPEPPSAQAPP